MVFSSVLPPVLDVIGVPPFRQDSHDVSSFRVVHDPAIHAGDQKPPDANAVRSFLDEAGAWILVRNPPGGFIMKLVGEVDVLPSPESLSRMDSLRLGF